MLGYAAGPRAHQSFALVQQLKGSFTHTHAVLLQTHLHDTVLSTPMLNVVALDASPQTSLLMPGELNVAFRRTTLPVFLML